MTFERFFIWPPLTLSGATRSHFGTKLAAFWGDLGRFWIIFLGWIRVTLGIILASFWCRFGPIVPLFWCFWDLVWTFLSHLNPFWGYFYGRFAVFSDVLGVDCNIKQSDAREAKICKFPPIFTKMLQGKPKICKFFRQIFSKNMQICAKASVLSL